MLSRRFAIIVDAARRALPALGLAAVLAFATLGLNAPARADEQDPDARLQIHINKIKIHDDKDWGEGDIEITISFWRVKEGCPPESAGEGRCITDLITSGPDRFGADDNETKVRNFYFPPDGFPVHAGQTYGWAIRGIESDEFFDDELGSLVGHVNQENGWGPLGTYTERGTVNDWEFDWPGTVVGEFPAHFTAEYEMRLAPLADLRPTSIELPVLAGSDDLVCMGVLNAGERSGGPFEMTLRVDGAIPANGTVQAGGLGPAQLEEYCVATALPQSGRHLLSVSVDEARVVPEMDERNNRLEQPFLRVRGTLGDGPGGGPGVIGTDPEPGLDPGPAVIGTEPGSDSPGVSTDPAPTPTPTPTPTATPMPPTPTPTSGPARPTPTFGPVQPKPSLR